MYEYMYILYSIVEGKAMATNYQYLYCKSADERGEWGDVEVCV
jgi:hypothetical protein